MIRVAITIVSIFVMSSTSVFAGIVDQAQRMLNQLGLRQETPQSSIWANYCHIPSQRETRVAPSVEVSKPAQMLLASASTRACINERSGERSQT